MPYICVCCYNCFFTVIVVVKNVLFLMCLLYFCWIVFPSFDIILYFFKCCFIKTINQNALLRVIFISYYIKRLSEARRTTWRSPFTPAPKACPNVSLNVKESRSSNTLLPSLIARSNKNKINISSKARGVLPLWGRIDHPPLTCGALFTAKNRVKKVWCW